MRSNTQELHRLRTSVSQQATADMSMSSDVLDEAFALVDESTWRCDSEHANEAEKALEQQLASLAEQSRELTQLLGKLRSSGS